MATSWIGVSRASTWILPIRTGPLVRFLTPAAVDGTGFVGVSFDGSGAPTFYATPRLRFS